MRTFTVSKHLETYAKATATEKDVFICLIDYEKAFHNFTKKRPREQRYPIHKKLVLEMGTIRRGKVR